MESGPDIELCQMNLRLYLELEYCIQSYKTFRTLENRTESICRMFFIKMQLPEHRLHYLRPMPCDNELSLSSYVNDQLHKMDCFIISECLEGSLKIIVHNTKRILAVLVILYFICVSDVMFVMFLVA